MEQTSPPSIRGILQAAAAVGGAGLWLATLLAFAGRLWWALDLFAHFRPQYLALAWAGALLLWLARERRAALLLGACGAVNALVLLPYLLPGALLSAPRPPPSPLRAMSVNVYTPNRDHGAVRRLVVERSPDFLLLMEVDEAWLAGLADLRREYPYGVAEPRDDNFGIALWSRHPCVRCEILHLGEARLPTAAGEFAVGGSRLTLVGTHPLPPVGAEYARQQADQLRALAAYLARVRGPKILMGDLNMTPWSAKFGPLLRAAGLRDSGVGRGTGRTWPVDNPLLGIPIDHFLASPDVRIAGRERGPDVGSDHFPLLVGFHPEQGGSGRAPPRAEPPLAPVTRVEGRSPP
jgi:endonuclease/exonuclease/phosphatase (EEP) superfamily protein YafD